ncbi:MAG: EF-P lysine aminoacylase EpmA [Patescibacteria group bacterium]
MKNWQKIKQNDGLKQQFLVREQVIDSLRVFFKTRGFHEVETPLLVKSPGTEPYLEVFDTTVKFAEGDSYPAYLLTSPEYAMKKLLAAGFGDIFQICKSFRNKEGRSSRHNPEFTILEYYRANADYTALMKDMEEMLPALAEARYGKEGRNGFEYQDLDIDLTLPFPRYSVEQAFLKFAGVSREELLSETKLIEVAKKKGYQVTSDTTWEQVYNQIFLNEIEAKLDKTRPTIIYDYPLSQAALSKRKASDPEFAERFEIYLAGIELGNAFSELIDGEEQEKRLKAELRERDALGKTKYELDTDFIDALKSGLPECTGIAIGVDRLVMLLANVPSIEDTLLFPINELFPS